MRIRLTTALLLIAVVLVGGFGVLKWQDLREAQDRVEDRAAALAVAKQEVLELTTLSPQTLDSTLESLNSRLTEEFSRQFEAFYATFASVIRKDQVASTGSIQSAAVVSADERQVVALVAARAEVTSKGQKSDIQRAYRFQLTMQKQGGDWLISQMRFVS